MTARLVSKVARLACPSALKNVRSLQAPRQHLAALSSPSFSSAVLTQTTSRQHRTESTPPRTAGVHSSHLGSLATSTTSSLLSTTHRYSSSSSGSSLPSSAGNSSTKPSPSGKTVGSDNSSDTSTDPTKDSSSGSSKDNSGDDNTAGGGGRRAGGNEDGRGRGPLTWGAVAFLGVAGALAVGYYRMKWDEKQKQVSSEVTSTGKPALGGPFTLVNMHGQPVTDKDFHGSFVMLYFGFCHCPDICPAELVKLGAIVEKLASKLGKGVVKPVFISVDPDRDSLAQLRYYAQDFHPRSDLCSHFGVRTLRFY